MSGLLTRVSLAALAVGALTLGGCATQEAVEHAQATADSALTHAQAGEAAAHRAQESADAATTAVQKAQSSADAAQASADAAKSAAAEAQSAAQNTATQVAAVTPKVAHLEHHHMHHTWRNVAHRRRHK